MAIRVVLDRAGVRELLRSQQVRDILDPPARAVLAEAQRTARVESGRYRDSLHIEDDTTDRAVKRIGSDLDYAIVREAEDGTLTRALDAAGSPVIPTHTTPFRR